MESPLLNANPKLKALLSDLESRHKREAQSIALLEGSGNTSYRVNFLDASLALRLNGKTEHLGVDRLREKSILELLNGTGICPDVIEWHEHYLATAFIPNSEPASLTSIAKTLRHLHEVTIPTQSQLMRHWSPIDTLRDYVGLSPDSLPVIESHIERLKSVNWQDMRSAICHMDLNPGNVLLPSGSKKAVFIDWEYARYGPIAYDIAVLIETNRLSHADAAILLDRYGMAPNHSDISASRLAYRLIEALWMHITQPDLWPNERVEALARDLDASAVYPTTT